MNTYVNQITDINETTEKLGNLTPRVFAEITQSGEQTLTSFPKLNRRARRHLRPLAIKRYQAKMDFLLSIHDEITQVNPNWRNDDDIPKKPSTTPLSKLIKMPAPDLTDEYLTELKIPTTLASMSSKAQLSIESLDGYQPGEHDESLNEAEAA